MKKMMLHACALLLALPLAAQAAVKGEEISYEGDGITMKGYLAYDDATQDKRPGVLVVHEWWGHNAYARKRAEMLAELGYTALAVDMYGDGKNTEHPKEAKEFMMAAKADKDGAKTRFEAALNTLTSHPTVDADKTAAIGYCFGGGIVLEMARKGVDLDGVASFHGGLATENPAQEGAVKAEIIVFHGDADPMVPPEQVTDFKEEMEKAGVEMTFVGYPGVKHAFTNPDADKFAEKFDLPVAYDKHADEQSWSGLQKFFKRIFE